MVEFGYEFVQKVGRYKNPKQEVLNNNLLKTKIKIIEWNNLIRSCARYVKIKKAKKMGLTIKEIVGLKLYTDFDELQREYRKCFRIEYLTQRLQLQKHFVHWNDLLISAYKKLKIRSSLLYHGLCSLREASTFNGKYYGQYQQQPLLMLLKNLAVRMALY